jgi:hypothetical protein
MMYAFLKTIFRQHPLIALINNSSCSQHDLLIPLSTMNTWIPPPEHSLNSSAKLIIRQPPNDFRQERGAPEVGQSLHELQDNFNPTTIRKSSKAHGTLDKQQMAGPLSFDQIAKTVENGPRISDIHNQMAALTRMLESNQFTADGSDRHSTTHATNARLVRQYGHPDGIYRRVPLDWKFPMLHLQPMYLY